MSQRSQKEILFPSEFSSQWTNQRWISSTSTRKLNYFGPVYRFIKAPNIWSRDHTCLRYMAIFSDPNLVLILRSPNNKDEVRNLLHLPTELLEESENGNSLVDSFYIAEVILDLLSCKLLLSKLTTPTSGISDDVRGHIFFELVSPAGNIHIALEDFSCPKDKETLVRDTKKWEEAICQALFAAHTDSNSQQSLTPGWKHHLVLGSLHSHVLLQNQVPLESIISSTRNKYPIDTLDFDGLTPLHCACYNRNFMAIATLISAGADCRMKTVNGDKQTPCHISAQLLDNKAISLMISNNGTRPDPNALDAFGRTPMYLAAVEGRNIHGSYDSILLKQCLSLFEEWGGQIMIRDDDSLASLIMPIHPIYILARQRRFADIPIVLSFSSYRFDLEDVGCESDDYSIASRHDYPIHACILSLRDSVRESGDVESNIDFLKMEVSMVSSLQILLEHGFEPNERIELVENRSSLSEKFKRFAGFSPIQIIYSLFHDYIQSQTITEVTLSSIKQILVSAAEVLIEFGARVDISHPPSVRPHRSKYHSREMDFNIHTEYQGELFDDEERRNIALCAWSEAPCLDASWISIDQDLLIFPIPDSECPGGNDHNSCSICWKDLTSSTVVMKERKICVLSKRYICQECSTKRFLDGVGQIYHISDGQYNLLRRDVDKRNVMDDSYFILERKNHGDSTVNDNNKSLEHKDDKGFHIGEAINKFNAIVGKEISNVSERLKTLINEDADFEKDDRIGVTSRRKKESMEKEILFDGGAPISSANQKRMTVIETEPIMAKTRNELNDRGVKIASIADKTASLKDRASNFALLSKELRMGQESRGFFF